jgi:hypothetical protein
MFFLGLAIAGAINATAQTESNTVQTKPGKLFQHQVGVQVNELIRQVFNFNNSSSTNTNPYLATYSINTVKGGWGARIGLGYDYRSISNDDGITARTSKLNDLRGRFGLEKMFALSSNWSAGVGLDAVVNYDDDYTKSVLHSFDTVTTITTSKITTYGGGPMAWLRYHISSKVLIGTETSYYYTTGKQDDNIAVSRYVFSGQSKELRTTFTTVNDTRSEGKLSIPVAFFLIVQF